VNNAVVGGGNVYQIRLDDPASVREAATSIFQTALGRSPTEAEFSKIASTVRSGEFVQQMATNQAQESMSQQQFQAEIAKRNAPYQPRIALGNVPNGSFRPGNQRRVVPRISGGGGTTIPVTQGSVRFVMSLGLNLSTPQAFQQAAQKVLGSPNIQAALASGDRPRLSKPTTASNRN
jgi:hypothetical protein